MTNTCPQCNKPITDFDSEESCRCQNWTTPQLCTKCRSQVEAEKLREGYDMGYAKCVRDNQDMIAKAGQKTRQKCWKDVVQYEEDIADATFDHRAALI